jgi:glutamate dehydrogenase/leucine dehydrogenase
LNGKKVLVQGIGHVGLYLVDYLNKEGAEIIISDINKSAIENVVKKYNCSVINPNDIYTAEMDVYAPCALGATVTLFPIEYSLLSESSFPSGIVRTLFLGKIGLSPLL